MMGPISFLLLTLTIQVTVFAIVIGAIQKFAMGKSPKAAAKLIAFGMLLLLGITAAVMIPFPSWFDLLGADRPHVITSNFDDEELLSLSLSAIARLRCCKRRRLERPPRWASGSHESFLLVILIRGSERSRNPFWLMKLLIFTMEISLPTSFRKFARRCIFSIRQSTGLLGKCD